MQRRMLLKAGAATLLAAGASAAYPQVRDQGDAVDKAGRQRMLTQRLAKAYLALGMDVADRLAREVLDASMALFDRQMVELKVYAPTPAIRSTYEALETAWGDYKAALVGRAPSRAQVPALVALDARVLALAQRGTVQYEAWAGRPAARLVNLCGRQRMLSQRCAKYYLVQAWDAAVPGAAVELGHARGEFVAAMQALAAAPQTTPALRDEIALASQQWVFFENALRFGREGAGGLQHAADVFTASENILAVMDHLTGEYARFTS